MQLLPIFNTEITEQISTATYLPTFTNEECDRILSYRTPDPVEGTVAAGKDKNIRDATIHVISYNEETKWLYEKMADRIARANLHYDFDLAGLYEHLAIMEYKDGGQYTWHLDIGPGVAAHRKLSAIVQLTSPSDYEGGEVVFNAGTERTLPKDRGMMGVFPSYVLHKVNPVTSGTRYSLVAWVSGQRRFK